MIKEKLRRIQIDKKFAPLLLFAITLAAHLPLAAQMGFYWDDWVMLYFKETRGAAGFASAFDSDRPFLSYLYQLTSLLPNDPVVWQILTVFVRYLVALAFYWVLKQLWEDHDKEILWISLFLAVYPGFKQMPISYVWLNGFILLLSYVLSYGLMLKSLRSSNKRTGLIWFILSLFTFTFCVVSTEYYVGLELCRGVVLWLYFRKDEKFINSPLVIKIRNIIAYWFPYALILGLFMVWRVFIFKFPGYQPVLVDQAAANPLRTIFDTFVRSIEDAYTATWGAWIEFIKFPNHVDFETLSGKIFWIAVVFSFAAILAVMWFYCKKQKTKDKKWAPILIFIGLFMVICPGFPFWVTYLPVRLTYPFDRFLVTFMFGSCIFIFGLINYSIRQEWLCSVILSLLAATAVGGNILNANSYRKDWNMQKDFISQLTTRIPSLKPDTILLSDNNPLAYESDNSMTGMINLAFDPGDEYHEERLPYSVMLFTPRFGDIETYEKEDTVYQDFRGLLFEADNKNVVVYHYSPPSCLRIIDPEQHSLLNIFPNNYKYFISLSDPKNRITSNELHNNSILDNVFHQRTNENWCYYFQKADLARQTEDWTQITEIGDKVLPIMIAADKSEYLVFAEAYMKTDRWNTAGELFGRIHHESSGTLDYVLCDYIHKWVNEHQPPSDKLDTFIKHINAVGCVYDSNDY